MLNKFKKSDILIIILFVSIFILRFIKIGQLFVFSLDEEYQSLLAWSQVKDFHPIWIGVSASNIGFYLGPGLVYLTALLLKISQGDPLILGYFSSFVGFITTVSLFFITRKLFNKKIALIAAIIYGFSELIIYYDRKYWPIGVPLVALWLIYFLVKTNTNPKYFLIVSFLMGVAYHLHLTLFLFWPIIIGFLIINRKKIKIQSALVSIVIFLAVVSPLIVYDFVHNFDNLKTPYRLISNLNNNSSSGLLVNARLITSTLVRVFTNNIIFQKFSPYISLFVIAVALIMLFRQFFSGKLAVKIIDGFSIVFLSTSLLYPGPMQEYYFVIFFPVLAIILAVLLNKLPVVFTYFFLALYVVTNILTFSQTISDNRHGLSAKKDLIVKTMRYVNQPYYLATKSAYRDNGGWHYLFKAYGKTPDQSDADQMFGWIYQDEISGKKPPLKIIITENKFIPLPMNFKEIKSGSYYSYITANK